MDTIQKGVTQAAEQTARRQELLHRLCARQGVDRERTSIPRRPEPDKEAPLSFGQERLWFFSQWEKDTAAYHMPVTLRLQGVLDVFALQQSLNEIVKRHEILRTVFVKTAGGEPVQIVLPGLEVELPVIDLGRQAEAGREQQLQRLVTECLHEPFVLEQAPLFRCRLIRLAPQDYAFIMSIHHILFDAWSSEVLAGEVIALYQAIISGDSVSLPPLAVQYTDFAVWQRSLAETEPMRQHFAYWQRRLGGELPLLELPADRPRSPELSYDGRDIPFTISRDIIADLEAVGRHEQASLFMSLLAAFNVLLFRFSGQTDILMGTPVAERTRPELRGLIGFFLNTLVLRNDLSGEPTFHELLRRVRETTLQAYAHLDFPFDKLVKDLKVKREPSRNPCFDVMFVFTDQAFSESPGFPGLKVTPLVVANKQALFDLTLALRKQPDGSLAGTMGYRTALFDEATVRRLLSCFTHLLTRLAAHPGQKITEVPLLAAEERQKILYDWNRTQVMYTALPTVQQIFQAQVSQTPGAVAVVCEGQKLTYRELNERVNRLAYYLLSQGTGPETLVGICLERSLELVVAIWAVLKAGGAYVPLDPAYPPARLQYMLGDAQVHVLLTKEAYLPLLPSSTTRLVCLDTNAEELAGFPACDPAVTVDERHPVYMIYTSGSTGQPKGAVNTHGGIRNRLLWMQERFRLSADDCVLQKTPFSFDVSVWEFLWPLMYGARLAVARPEGHKDSDYLVAEICAQQVTTIHFVPSMLRIFLENPRLSSCRSLKRVICSGEALPYEVLERFGARLEAGLYNLYGPTEAAVDVTCWSCTQEHGRRSVPIGTPIANTQIYILDEQLQPVPVGVSGELYIGGVNLARGYHRRPALTATKFIPNPYGSQPGARLYRTGDLARYLDNGWIEFLGRTDFQVKIRGFRIELEEIEAVLVTHPDIKEAVVVACEDGPEKRLAAYLLPKNGQPGVPHNLRSFLQSRLPDYMLPAFLVALDRWPLTPNGKLDRKALPAPADSRSAATPYIPPVAPTEQLLAAIWQEVLKRERVGRWDDFFESGGHSLLATQVLSRIRNVYGVEISLRALFKFTRLNELACHLEEVRRAGQGLPATAIVRLDHKEPPPLSFAQERLWIVDSLSPGLAAYNMFAALRLTGQLDVPALERSVNEIRRRHAVLRTTFRLEGDQPVQLIASAAELPLARQDLGCLAPEPAEQEIKRLIEAESVRPFDLAQGPLLRLLLLDVHPEEHILLINMHHIVADGWSVGILLDELTRLYTAFSTGRPSPLAELPVQYADYAVWQRCRLQGEFLEAQAAYWHNQLAGAPLALELPADRPRPTEQSFTGATRSFALTRELSRALRSLADEQHVTLFMLLLSAFYTLLFRYTGEQDMVVGTPVANRNRLETEGLIGCFINILALRARPAGDLFFPDFLAQVRKMALDAYSYQDYPFEKLVEGLVKERDFSHSQLVQVLFVLQNTGTRALELPGLTIETLETGSSVAKYDLTLSLTDRDEGLQVLIEYNACLFTAATIGYLFRRFEALLEAIVAYPRQRLAAFSLFSASERRQLLATWNRHTAERDRYRGAQEAQGAQGAQGAQEAQGAQTVHQLFEAQVLRTPAAIAIIDGEKRLTYEELNEQANYLAHYLISLGAGPDVPVGICLDRSSQMIIAVWAVLKAGGAYLPLDPAYPSERLVAMASAARVPLIIARQESLPALADSQARVIVWDQAKEIMAGFPASNPAVQLDARHLAYVIYTSGSTGRPKGVMVSHQALINHARSMLAVFRLKEGDRMLQAISLSFDAAAEELFPALLSGAALVLVRTAEELWGGNLEQLCFRYAISHLHLPVALWHQWSRHLALHRLTLPASLAVLLVGGEQPAPDALRDTVAAIQAPLRFMNAYGLTETTITSLLYEVTCCQGEDPGVTHIPCGRPLVHVQVYILDSELEPVPAGVTGELYIGGDGLARGYLDKPGLTAERFLPDPFAGTPGARMYQTGDSARYRPDGQIEYLGRKDEQIKIRGFRIEPGEIEAVLKTHPAVNDAVVLVYTEGAVKALAAYLVPGPGCTLTENAVRLFARERLPAYMLPAYWLFLDRLPLTVNGKLDRKALPTPVEYNQPADSLSAPRTQLEKQLAGIWQNILGIQRLGIHDNFFTIGGDSLLSLRVLSAIRQAGLPVGPRDLLKHPTIAALAARISEIEYAHIPEEETVSGPVPLLPSQAWFLYNCFLSPQWWNIASIYYVREMNWTPALLEQAVRAVLRQHDGLRARFICEHGSWRQELAAPDKPEPLPVTWQDLSAEPEPEAVIRNTVAEAQRSLDLFSGPVLRFLYFDLGLGQDKYLAVILHHLVADGVSLRLILEDLLTACRQLRAGAAVQLLPKTSSVRTLAAYLQNYAQSTACRERLTQLRALPWKESAILPADYPACRYKRKTRYYTSIKGALAGDTTACLTEALPRLYQVAFYDILLAALVQSIARWTGQSLVALTVIHSGRETMFADTPQIDLSRTVGWLATSLPFLFEYNAEESPDRLLTAIHEQRLKLEQNGLSLVILGSQYAAIAENPLPAHVHELVLNFRGRDSFTPPADGPLQPAGISPGDGKDPDSPERALLGCLAYFADNRLQFEWIYNKKAFRQSTIRRLSSLFVGAFNTLAALARLPDQSPVGKPAEKNRN